MPRQLARSPLPQFVQMDKIECTEKNEKLRAVIYGRPLIVPLSLRDVRAFSSISQSMTLDCADGGNRNVPMLGGYFEWNLFLSPS